MHHSFTRWIPSSPEMASTKCERGCMARNDELPHSKRGCVKTPSLQLHHCLCLFFDHYQMEAVSGLIRQLRLANLVLQKWTTIFSVVIFSLSATYCKISTFFSAKDGFIDHSIHYIFSVLVHIRC